MAINTNGIVNGLGGIDNIEEISGDITRVFAEVSSPDLVDEAALKMAGAQGVVLMGRRVVVVVGNDGHLIADAIADMKLE
jgi:PTS system N-acetylglucosamine-specific IIB component